ncbi:MAG: DUF896 domain-containing protein [Streptococcaceae bacterium]|jgi:uncharacterized protein YnzC (UPF0291/DUF896 family)|nr:DUF896 domain-containing protein [Streptococcaceae bacterium]
MAVTKEQITRINELAHKQKSEVGLTDDERAEQQVLRQMYLDAVKESFKAELDNIELVDDEGAKS